MDNERVKLKVLGISYNPMQSGAFAMLLAEEDGPYRIPVVIGASEAQSIAIKLEGVVTPRPMTHDLFVNFARAYGIALLEVNIYKFEDGIFSSELKFTDGERTVAIDSRTSDAVAIAVRTGAPIYTTRTILQQAGTKLDENNAPLQTVDEEQAEAPAKLEDLAVEDLQSMLDKYIKEENYEEAGKISKIIKDKKNK